VEARASADARAFAVSSAGQPLAFRVRTLIVVRTAPDPDVRSAYRRSAGMQLRRDPTFFLATRRLPPDVRPAVHGLYGFVRGADDIVDAPGGGGPNQRRAALDAWQAELEDGIARGSSTHPVIAALVDAGRRHDLPLTELRVYMDSMRVDCDRVRMADRTQLDAYMNGSAAAVGRIMAPLLGAPAADRETVAALGVAFQLTNYVRDVREDWEMDRIYLPGLGEDDLARSRASAAVREQVAAEAVRARGLFADTRSVLGAVRPEMRTAMRVAGAIYERVLDRVERIGFDVLGRRTSLGPLEIASALAGAARAA
jgi:phytoene synthase